MKEIKEGTIVKYWDKDTNGVHVGFYVRPHDKCGHIISRTEDTEDSSRWDHVEPLYLMPELPDGVRIGDEVEMQNEGGRDWSIEILADHTVNGKYIDQWGDIWDHCRAIKKEKLVKRLSKIIRMVEDTDDCTLCGLGAEIYYKGALYRLLPLMSRSGLTYQDDWDYPEEWLEDAV